MEPDEPPRNLFLCGIGFVGAGVMLALLAWWLVAGGLAAGQDALAAPGPGSRGDPHYRVLRTLLLSGGLVGVIACFTLVFGVISLGGAVAARSRVKPPSSTD